MLLEAAAVFCLTNTTDTAVNGMLRDDRFKTTSAKLAGNSLTYRAPVAETPFPVVAAGQTGCAPVDAATFAKPHLVVWTGAPMAQIDVSVDWDGDAACRPAAPPKPGQRITFVYRKSLLGQLSCKETR